MTETKHTATAIERFDLDEGGFLGERSRMVPSEHGDYVSYSDHVAVQEQAVYWKGAYDRMASRNIEVSAEHTELVAALRDARNALDDLAAGRGVMTPLETTIRQIDAALSAEEKDAPTPAGVYTASKTVHADKWRALRDDGWPIVATWIDEAGVGETECFTDLWERCVREASNASAVLLYREAGEVLKGAFIETGAALSNGVPVHAVGCSEFSFVNHRLVTQHDTLSAALSSIRGEDAPKDDGVVKP